MNYYDLHCPTALQAKDLSLGWTRVIEPRVLFARKHNDLDTPQKGVVIAESESLDLLLHALKRENIHAIYPALYRDWHKDDQLVQACADNGKPFEIRLNDFLHRQGYPRARLIIKTRQFLQKCRKRNARIIITNAARNAYDLKSPRDAIAIGTLLGLTPEQAEYAISKQPEKTLKALEE